MNDLISRQAALDMIDAIFPVDPTKSEYAQGIACGAALAKTYVEQLPSAQPEHLVKESGNLVKGLVNDCISRQAAIDALCDNCDDVKAVCAHFPCKQCIAIEQLPSAQQERLTDDDFETIRIHLNAYKESLGNQHRCEEAEEYQRIIDRFMAFASAQPEQIARDIATIIENEQDMRVVLKNAEHTETHACDYEHTETHDLISRQAAIDALGDKPLAWTDGLYELGLQNQWQSDVDALKDLPPVQPESKREWYMHGYRDAQRWIPFETREPDAEEKQEHPEWDFVLCGKLPQDGQRILVNIKYKGHEAVQMDEYNDDGRECYLHSGYDIATEATAWMPLPKPWKGEEHEL